MSRRFEWAHNVSPADNPPLCHPFMIPQRYHHQLGQISVLKPGATHTRFNHCGYTGHIAGAIYDVLASKGKFPGSRQNIIAGAQHHDGAHGPFSHGIEYLIEQLTGTSHNQRIVSLLQSDLKDRQGQTPRDALLKFGADPDEVIRLLRDKPPVSQVWSHRVIGADILAYLIMDAAQTDFSQQPPDWEVIIPHYTFTETHGLGIELKPAIFNDKPYSPNIEKPIDLAVRLQSFFFTMYTQLYHCPASIALQRHVQKAVELAINAGALDPHDVWDMEDQTLLDRLKNGDRAADKQLMHEANHLVNRYERQDCYVPAAEFVFDSHAKGGQIGITPEFGADFVNAYKDPRKQTELEAYIQSRVKVPVLLAFFPDPKKLKPADTNIYQDGKVVTTLHRERPDLVASCEAQVQYNFYINVLADRDELAVLRRPYFQGLIRDALIEGAMPTLEAYRSKKEADRKTKEKEAAKTNAA